MTEQGHSPVERATLAVKMAARENADRAMALFDEADAPMSAYERITSARLLRVDALTVLDRVVLTELLRGASFDEVAGALGLPADEARRRYEESLESGRAQLAAGAPGA